MSEALVEAVSRPPVARTGSVSAGMALPAVIVDAGPVAVERFLEFLRGLESPTGGRGRRTGGRWAVPDVVCGSGSGPGRDRAAARGEPTSARIRGRRRR